MSKIMKVGELIEILKQFPQDENVVIKKGTDIYKLGCVNQEIVYPYTEHYPETSPVIINANRVVASSDDRNDPMCGVDDRDFSYGIFCLDDEW